MERRKFIGTITALSVSGATGIQLLYPETESLKQKPGRIPRRILGKTGVEVTSLILGGVSGMMQKPTNEFNPAELANAALDLGINYFDTAPSYNSGQSETNYGFVLAKRRKEVFLATKTTNRTYDGAMKEFEESLKRLQTDHVDLYQVHGVRENEDVSLWDKPDGVLRAMYKLRDEKVIRFIGVTGHESADAMNRAIDMYNFDTILTTFNPVPRRKPFRETVLPNALGKKMGIIAMKVMGGGEGALAIGNPPVKPTNGNWYWDEAKHQAECTDLLRYVLGFNISCANVGMKSLNELETNVRTAKEMKPFTHEEQMKLENFMI